MLSRSVDDFKRDHSTANFHISLDVDTDELDPHSKFVHYIMLSKHVSYQSVGEDAPIILDYVSGIIVQEVREDHFRRLGYFRQD